MGCSELGSDQRACLVEDPPVSSQEEFVQKGFVHYDRQVQQMPTLPELGLSPERQREQQTSGCLDSFQEVMLLSTSAAGGLSGLLSVEETSSGAPVARKESF